MVRSHRPGDCRRNRPNRLCRTTSGENQILELRPRSTRFPWLSPTFVGTKRQILVVDSLDGPCGLWQGGRPAENADGMGLFVIAPLDSGERRQLYGYVGLCGGQVSGQKSGAAACRAASGQRGGNGDDGTPMRTSRRKGIYASSSLSSCRSRAADGHGNGIAADLRRLNAEITMRTGRLRHI